MSRNVQELHSLFKTCLDILRNDAEHLIGDEALNELSYFLILKQIEKHIENNNIDIFNLNHYDDNLISEYNGVEKFKEKLQYVKFSKFVEYVKITENECNIKNVFDGFIWKKVLSKHPKLKDVFEDGKKSFIKTSKTIKNLVITLSTIDFNNYDNDILGEAYEKIFVDAVFGAGGNKKSELGQFFTPHNIKELLIKLVNPKIKENGDIESVLDPASGTGGILNNVIKHFKHLGVEPSKLREQLIKHMYGIEIKGKIYNLCLSNMLINTGEILPNVICADSIRKFHNIKVDCIMANPPFSVTIKYEELLSALGNMEILNNYVPIKAGGKNSEMLFLQMSIHCLNINGRCAMVMLDGQKIYGSSSGNATVREYLMKSCDLQEVINCPAGTFTSTNSKTCILFFTKIKERIDVVEHIGNKRTLKFNIDHSTNVVKFYDFHLQTNEKQFIREVSINDIKLKKYSLKHSDYDIEEEKQDDENIKWLELGEVCDFKNGKNITKEKLIEGEYPVIGGGQKPLGYHTEYNTDENTIIISKDGAYAGYVSKYNTKVLVSNHGIYINNVKENTIKDYIYYYLKLVLQNKLYSLQIGAAQPGVNKEHISKLKIPIPSIEKQKEIVEFLDKLFNEKYNLKEVSEYYENDIFKLLLTNKYDNFKKLVEWQYQSNELLTQIQFVKKRQTNYLCLMSNSETNIKTLGEVCDFKNGKNITKEKLIEGEYPVIGGGQKPLGYHNEYNTNEHTIIISKDGAYAGYVSKYNTKVLVSNHGIYINNVKENTIKDYIYYYLKLVLQNKLYSLQMGAAQPGVNKEHISKLKIPIPSIEKQKEIVEYCDYNDLLIKQLEGEIENNKTLAKQFIMNIV